MTEPTNPAPLAPAAPPQTAWQKWSRVLTIVFGVIILLGGLVKIYKSFTPDLPGCAASETEGVIRDIFKQKKIELTKLNEMTTVDKTASEENCRAHIETADETGTISYHVTLEGKEFKVLITKVDAKPR